MRSEPLLGALLQRLEVVERLAGHVADLAALAQRLADGELGRGAVGQQAGDVHGVVPGVDTGGGQRRQVLALAYALLGQLALGLGPLGALAVGEHHRADGGGDQQGAGDLEGEDVLGEDEGRVADTIVRTVELGVTITDAAVDGDTTVVFCNLLDDGQRGCPGCGGEGRYRDTMIRSVTDVPVVGHPLRLRVRVPRYRCVNTACEREVFAHNTSRLARPGWSTTRRCARYICHRLMIDRATVAAVARELGLSWDTVNTIAMDATQQIVAARISQLDSLPNALTAALRQPRPTNRCTLKPEEPVICVPRGCRLGNAS